MKTKINISLSAAKPSTSISSDAVEVNLKDLYIFQDNSQDMDKKWIASLVKKIKSGQSLESVVVLRLTLKFKSDLRKLKTKLSGMDTHTEYAEGIEESILTTDKKWVLLDGNHRYLAAKAAKLLVLPAEKMQLSAEEYVDYIFDGYL